MEKNPDDHFFAYLLIETFGPVKWKKKQINISRYDQIIKGKINALKLKNDIKMQQTKKCTKKI